MRDAGSPSTGPRVRLLSWLAVATLVWTADRITKTIVTSTLALGQEVQVLPIFSWVRLHNEGAAFSMFQDAGEWKRWFFVMLATVFSVYLVTEIRRLAPGQWLQALAFSLILGGALGNLYDRLTVGYVVDFALVYWRNAYFPAFNVADSAITIGAITWITTLLIEWRARRVASES
jgi:signal peptidase II